MALNVYNCDRAFSSLNCYLFRQEQSVDYNVSKQCRRSAGLGESCGAFQSS